MEHGNLEWNPTKDTRAVQGLVSTLLASCGSSDDYSRDAHSLDALITDLAARCAASGGSPTRGQAAAAGIDLCGLLQTAESTLSQHAKAYEVDPFLAATLAHAALLASMDSEAAISLLEEPWLSFLAASVTAALDEETDAGPSSNPSFVARRLSASAALVSAARQMEAGFAAYGPGESGSRAKARLRTELLTPQRISAVLSNAAVRKNTRSTEGAEGKALAAMAEWELRKALEETKGADISAAVTPDVEVAQRATALCCRRLLELMTDDLDACGMLLKHGALDDLLRTAQAEGGATAAGVAAAIAALSASPEFAGALADMPPLQGCAIVDLAAAELQRLGPALKVAGASAAGIAVPCFGALLNVCRADAPSLLVHRLADRGIVGLLIDMIGNSNAPKDLRLETADALCRLIPLEDTDGDCLPVTALQGIAAPAVVIALVGLCSDSERRRSGRGSFGNAALAMQGPCEALRYRLPWLLAGVARIAATADLKAWTEEETGVRNLLVDGFSSSRSKEVQAWCLDVLAALCGRLAPDVFIRFLCRGPAALLDLWSSLLDSKNHTVRARAIVVGYYATSCLPLISASSGMKARMDFLSTLPLRGVDSDFWSGSGAEGDAGRQLAQVAAAAAAVFAGEPLPADLAWYTRIAVCRVIASGLSALQLLNTPGEFQRQRPRAHREAVEVLFAWLEQVFANFDEVLLAKQSPAAHGNAELHPEAAALLADFLNGPLQAPTRTGKDTDADNCDYNEDEEELVTHSAGKGEPDDALGGAKSTLRAQAARLLEMLLFGQELYPGLEAALSEEDVRLRAEKPSSMPTSAPLALERAVRSLGEVEYGRWLTRLLIRSFSCTAADAEHMSSSQSVEDHLKSLHPRADGSYPRMSRRCFTDSAQVPFCPLETTMDAAEVLDSFLHGTAGKTNADASKHASGIAIGGGHEQFLWVGNLLSSHNRRGLRIILRFLDRTDGAAKYCGANRPLLAAAVLQRIAVNRCALRLGSFVDAATSGIAFGLAAQLLEPLTLALQCLEDSDGQDELLNSAAFERLDPCIRFHRATVEAFAIPRSLQQDVSLLADGFAYLWALVHALGAVQPLQAMLMKQSGLESASAACKACAELWHLVLDTLSNLLSERAVVQALRLSDDNASVLASIRRFLGKSLGLMPIFASPKVYRASLESADSNCSPHIIDLHSESWCPPGRILLAAVSRLQSFIGTMSSSCLEAYEKFFAVTMDAAVQVVEFVARPANILNCSADVLALLADAASIITTMPAGLKENPIEWKRRAATLLVTILHRPSIEALLEPDTSLKALSKVPNGMAALQWCASPDSDISLGSCGVRARELLGSLDDTSALEEAGVFEKWLQEEDPLELLSDDEVGFHEDASQTTLECGTYKAETTREVPQERLPSAGDEVASNALKAGSRFSVATGIASECYDPERASQFTPQSRPQRTSGQSPVPPNHEVSGGVSHSAQKPGSRLKMATGVATQRYDPQAPPAKQDAGTGASDEDIDGAEHQQLREEVSALGAELGVLEAELDAELHDLENEPEESEDEVYSDRLGSRSAVDGELVFTGFGCGPEAEGALPEEAFEWLRLLMAGESGLAPVRDSILGLLVRASQEQSNLSEFEAECLLEIYKHDEAQEHDTPDAGTMRLALRYLYENAPSWSDHLPLDPAASQHPVELDGLFHIDAAVGPDTDDVAGEPMESDVSVYLLEIVSKKTNIGLKIPNGYRSTEAYLEHPRTGVTILCPPLQVSPLGSNEVVLYHYTDRAGFDAAVGEGGVQRLRALYTQSTHFGDGIYATRHPPDFFEQKEDILVNSHTNSCFKQVQRHQIKKWQESGHADYCVPMIVSRDLAVNVSSEKTKEMIRSGYTLWRGAMRDDRDIWVVVVPFDGPAEERKENLDPTYIQLTSLDFSMRLDAVETLAGQAALGDARAKKCILKALYDRDANVQIAAIWAIVGSRAWTALEVSDAIKDLSGTEPAQLVFDAVKDALGFLQEQEFHSEALADSANTDFEAFETLEEMEAHSEGHQEAECGVSLESMD